ncbi:hypothetical protein BKA62DRAFT_18946 [Auriculariales sp. MPI-PUGE-AT-0066]|nr:hypothetical protein BKA62DRAFT_18946 [Auriculariales sp. MPI-PUGE-AT-0066]
MNFGASNSAIAGSGSQPLTVAPRDVMPPPTEVNGATAGSDHSEPTIIHQRALFTGYVYNELMMLHKNSQVDDDGEHPEDPQRISEIWQAFRRNGLNMRMKEIPSRVIERDECLLVHSEDLWDRVLAIQRLTAEQIISSAAYYEHLSLYVSESTTQCAMLSCGATVEAVLAVAASQIRNAFAIVRPPGHHAEPEEHMGFCFFNNVAVAIRVAQAKGLAKKVLILDWDVHHGNGTQRAFWDDPSVLYMSIHRYDGGSFYPGGSFGSLEMCGDGPGLGFSVNVPWPEAGMGDADYLYAFQNIIMPIAYEFAPDLVIISAGFDAAEGDPLGLCKVTPAGYAHMTYMLSSLANGKVCVVLEGGYKLDAISNSSVAVARVLLGEAPPALQPIIASEVATQTVWLCSRVQSRYWKSIVPKALEPPEYEPDPTYTVTEILSSHRRKHLYDRYEMMDIPLLDPDLRELYKGQLLCSPDILSNTNTTLVFVHDIGDLRVEHRGVANVAVNVERSYMIDASDRVLKLAKQQQWAVLDLTVFERPFEPGHQEKAQKSAEKQLAAVLEYVWDNYLQLSESKNIILMSYGLGATTIGHLLRSRVVTDKVRAVVHVVGHDSWPVIPSDSQEWWKLNSLTVFSSTHLNASQPRFLKRLGRHIRLDESRLIKLLPLAIEEIANFLQSKLRPTVHINGSSELPFVQTTVSPP